MALWDGELMAVGNVHDEQTPLLTIGNKKIEYGPKRSLLIYPVVAMGFFLASALVVVNYSYLGQSSSAVTSDDSLNSLDGLSQATNSNLDFTLVRSGYKPLDFFSSEASELYSYFGLKSYVAIIEPNVAMNLYITTAYTDELYYEYSVCSLDNVCYGGMLSSSDGGGTDTRTVTIPCDVKAEYIIAVSVFTVDKGTKVDTQTASAICLYVRRDIRSLTETDLGIALDAMFTLWSTTEEDGRTLYGDSFHSIDYMTELHHFGTAWQDSDHINDGLGFLPQRIKLTSIFEKAVQAVDNTFSLPYWDYTIDSSAGDNVFDNDVFDVTTFGTVVSSGDSTNGWTYSSDDISSGAISDGRWTKTRTLQNVKYTELQNAFGYLRAPWNMNPSPYLSRFGADSGSLPSCESHYNLLALSDMMDFLAESPQDSYQPTHSTVGGVFGCDAFDDLTGAGYINDASAQTSLCSEWGSYLKELYRSNYIAPFTNCSYNVDDLNDYTCGFTCNEEYEDFFVDKLKGTINSDYVPSDMADSGWDAWKSFVCEGDGYRVFEGDMLQTSSPLDPSFWVLHPTLERLYHAKMMSGGFDSTEWPTDATSEYVCSRSTCYEEDEGGEGAYSECCYGHFQYDQMLDFIGNNKSEGFGLTNDFVMTATDPTSSSYSMAYVYDTFTWPHCATLGSDFDALLWSYYQEKLSSLSNDAVQVVVEEEESEEDFTQDVTDVNDVGPNVNDPSVNDPNVMDPNVIDPNAPNSVDPNADAEDSSSVEDTDVTVTDASTDNNEETVVVDSSEDSSATDASAADAVVEATSSTEAVVEESTEDTDATEAVVEESTEDTDATEAVVEENSENTDATEAVVEESTEDTDATEAVVEESGENTDATEVVVEESTEDTDATEAVVEESGENTDATEAVVEESTEDTDATEAVVEENGEDTDATEAVVEEITEDADATDAVITDVTVEDNAFIETTSVTPSVVNNNDPTVINNNDPTVTNNDPTVNSNDPTINHNTVDPNAVETVGPSAVSTADVSSSVDSTTVATNAVSSASVSVGSVTSAVEPTSVVSKSADSTVSTTGSSTVASTTGSNSFTSTTGSNVVSSTTGSNVASSTTGSNVASSTTGSNSASAAAFSSSSSDESSSSQKAPSAVDLRA